MKKKKIISVIAAVAVVASLAVGSLAWFTSKDNVTNKFSTISTEEPNNPDSGIKIHEDFDKTTAGNVLPGTKVRKLVQVKSTAKYDQLIRVKIDKVWRDSNNNIVDSYYTQEVDSKDAQGNPIKDAEGNSIKINRVTYYNSTDKNFEVPKGVKKEKLDTKLIQLNFGNNLSGASGKWIDNTKVGGDNYYYYNGKLQPEQETAPILESVTLAKNAENIYRGLNFDVVVTADGIQAVNGAAKDSWTQAPVAIQNLGGELSEK